LTARPTRRAYLVGVALALATAACLSAQDTLSAPGAKSLTGAQFVFVNQIALLVAAPLFLIEPQARRDFRAILGSSSGRRSLVWLTLVGLAGLVLFNLGLRHAHPVVVSAILNLAPFWAALSARVVAGVPVPVSAGVFAVSLAATFAGAMTVAYSQTPPGDSGLGAMFSKGSWYFAIPVPLLTALSGTLLGVWFKDRRESAAVAAALFVPAVALIPVTAFIIWRRGESFAMDWRPVALLAVGAIVSSAFGRLLYQRALTVTGGDNGFVTMFFLLGPALAGLYAWVLSNWIGGLAFSLNAEFFAGMALTTASLIYFARRSRAAAGEPESAP
jgi:drug/metabolite transporter (DMT)-like permease